MIRYHFDLYPRDDPKDGARLVRFTKLQSMEYRAEANGTGAGTFSIRADDAEAAFIDPRGLQYVRVVEEGATEDERVVGGFWLETGDFGALTSQETRLLTFGGPGTIAYLGREVLWSRAYLYAADNIIDGTTWHFYNQPSIAGGDYLGAVLWRVMAEAQSFASPVVEVDDKPETAIPESSTSFGQFNDSAANLWTVPSGEFKAQVGDNILTIVRRLMEAGLYVEANPDTFVINAWERGATSSRGQDKTGPAWATDVIRFQAPTDGTVATGNVKSDAKRGVSPFLVASTVLAGDNGTYVAETDATVGVAWHRWQQSDAQDTDTLTYIADSQLASRGDAADTLRLRMKIGTDPTLGEYIPLSDYEPSGTEPDGSVMLNDLVTVHTGTGQWDYNEDTFPVAALTISLRPGGDWDAWVDLGSSYTSMAERAFQARGVATHTHPPNPRLCVPGTINPDTQWLNLTWDDGQPETVPNYPSGTGNWPAAPVVGGGGQGNGLGYVNVSYTNGQGSSGPLPATPGETYRWHWWARRGGGFLEWPQASVSYYTAANALIRTDTLLASSSGYADWTEVIAPDSVAPANAAYMVWAQGGNSDYDTLTATLVGVSSVEDGHRDLVGTGGRATRCDHRHDVHRDTAPTVNDDWATKGYKLGTVWAQLDSLVTPTAILGTWMLVDITTGAAVWLEMGGGVTDHGALTGLADDDHPQYIKDSEFGAKGRILIGTGVGTFDDLVVGTNTHVLTADSAEATGVKWAANPAGFSNPMTTAGDIIKGGASGVAERLAIGTAGQVLTVNAGATAPEWAAASGSGGGWTQQINESGASLTGWTGVAGTWATTGTVITQGTTTAAQAFLRYDTLYRMGRQVVEFDTQIITNAGSNYSGVVVGTTSAGASGGIVVRLLRGTGIQIERNGVANVRTHTATINASTWYRLKVDVTGPMVSVYLDGTLLGSTFLSLNAIADYFGLWSFGASVEFRNIEVWTHDIPT